jgi:hypothetical protein
MQPPNEFWLRLHELSLAYEGEGRDPDQRNENIVKEFQEMPLVAQHEVLDDLVRIVANLPAIYPAVVAAAQENEAREKARQTRRKGA